MKKAIIKKSFSVTQWFGYEYAYYENDAKESAYEVGDEVLIVHEAKSNPMGKLYVVYNERINEASVVSETFLEFIN